MARKAALLLLLVCLACVSRAQSADETKIRDIITAQTAAWNQGDVEGFMKAYEDSPQTTFVGMTVNKGYRPIFERYKEGYKTKEQMGTLTFIDIDVRVLPGACGRSEVALVTGRFHLTRSQKGAATKDDGIFSLVWRKGPHGWKIILDHTS